MIRIQLLDKSTLSISSGIPAQLSLKLQCMTQIKCVVYNETLLQITQLNEISHSPFQRLGLSQDYIVIAIVLSI